MMISARHAIPGRADAHGREKISTAPMLPLAADVTIQAAVTRLDYMATTIGAYAIFFLCSSEISDGRRFTPWLPRAACAEEGR